MRIIVVEDDADLREELIFNLAEDGFRATGVSDGAELFPQLHQQPADMIILDVGLPGEDGFSITRRIRANPSLSSTGIIMLTGRGELSHRIQGLTIGADIYLVKPIDFLELRACIESLSRRLSVAMTESANGCWNYCASQWELVSPAGTRIKLTLNEKKILEVLIQNPGAPVKRGDIISKGLGASPAVYDERRLETTISRLRRKISQSHAHSQPIQVAHGVGYAFTEPVTTTPEADH